jgi:hypothetical protein
MNISNYHLGDVYQQKVLLREYNSPVEDTKNSYQLTASMNGPGNGKTTGATDTSPNNFDSKVMFPKDQEISNEMKKNMLIKFLSDEIDNGKFKEATKNKFKELLDHLLDKESAEEAPPKKKKS